LQDYPLAVTGIYALMPERRLVPPRVRAFVDFLAERWQTSPPGSSSPALGLPES